MAEKLPKYRPLGVSIPGVSSVDYVSTGRARGAVFTGVANALDRMSEFAFERQKAQVIKEGTEYGAANAPTAAQMKDALKSGEEPAVFSEEQTVFAQAARKAAIQTAQANMENSTRQAITSLRLSAIETDMPVEQYTEQVNNIINGFAEAMDSVSPAAAVNFRAAMSANANSSVLAHATKLAERQEKQAKVDAELGADLLINGPADVKDGISSIDDAFVAGSTFASGEQGYVSLNDKLAVLRKAVADQAAGGGQALVASKLKAFDAAVDARYVQTVSDWAMQQEDPLYELSTGAKSDPKTQDLLFNMDADQKRLAVDDIFTRVKNELSLESAMDARGDRNKKERSDKLVVDIVNARLSGAGSDVIGPLLDRLSSVDAGKFEQLSENIYKEGAIDNGNVVASLQISLLNKSLTSEAVINAFSDGNLSVGTFKTLLGNVDALRNEDHTQAMDYVRNTLMPMPAGAIYSVVNLDKEAAKQVADIETSLIVETRLNPSVNRLEFVRKKVKELQADAGPTKAELAQNMLQSLIDNGTLPRGTTLKEAKQKLFGKTEFAEQLNVLVGK